MRFGYWRGVMFAVALISGLAATRSASADGFHKTIPREVLAQDLNTGEPYMAPAIPWGHYAKDGLFDSFYPKSCGLCLGKGCKACGGSGLRGLGHGLGGLGHGLGGACGHGLFNHCGLGGGACGHGLFNHCGKGGSDCSGPGWGGGHGGGRRVKDCGLCKNKGCGFCKSSGAGEPIFAMASGQMPSKVVPPSPQGVPMSSGQCGDAGCGLGRGHGGMHGSICDGCSGKGCGKCGGKGLLHGLGLGHGRSMGGDACGSCSGRGCGKCGGLGFLGGLGKGCGACGGKGCGACGLGGLGKGCGACGGKGCGACGLGGLGGLKGKFAGILHHNKGNIKYFVGPGGPIPLTPGYTPYVVTTRSPRDYFAFPPYTPE